MYGLTLECAGAPSALQGRRGRASTEPRTGRILRAGNHGAGIQSVMDNWSLLALTPVWKL